MAQNQFLRNTALSNWLNAATKEHKELLYSFSHKSADAVSQWASGRRNMSAGNAGAVVEAMWNVVEVTHGVSNGVSNGEVIAPVPLTRGDLCAACKQCPHYKASQQK